ncbi:MAG: transglycosylase SLT domain-containing protein, partial [Caldilineales bacterium]|nr:transglycosylase SLT domain-containing protein [Caldilineales bacterium]
PSPPPPPLPPPPPPSSSPSPPPPLPPSPPPPVPPSPPPSVPASPLLRQADRFVHNGDLPSAISSYQAALAASPSDDLTAEIRFGLGKALWRQGDVEAAGAEFERLSQDAGFIAARPEALYWLGRSRGARGQAEAAAAALRAYAKARPLLAGRAFEAAGQAYAEALDPAPAIVAYEQALALAPDTVSALRVREGLAATHTLAGDPAAAIEQYQAILSQARNPGYRAETLYLRGQAQLAAGQTDAAWQSFDLAMRAHPESTYAYLAAIELVNAGQPVDDLLRARVDFAARAYEPGFAALTNYRAANPGHDGEAYALAAQAYESQNNYGAAAREWDRLLQAAPADKRAAEAWLGKARSQWRQGDTAGAAATYLLAAERSPDRETAATSLWWAGFLAERDQATLLAAAAHYRRLAADYPESKFAAQSEFRAGLAAYRAGDVESARAGWSALAAANKGTWSAAADFWLGKMLLAEGKAAEASEHWRAAAQRWGEESFYGLRAAQEVEARTGDYPLAPHTPAPADLGTWLKSWATGSSDLAAPPPPELERAAELHRIGEYALASADFEALRQRWPDDPAALLRLAITARDLGYYDTSIRAAARVYTLSGQPLAQLPPPLQEILYPLHYADLILPAAAKNGLDPDLFLALIRQESLFGAVATSGAAARGLAQIIPSTGRSIAERLNWPNYSDEMLYLPYINVPFGAFYLAQSRESAGGNIWQALAGYNGGPGNAAFWRRLAGPDDDLFIELINFAETQTYLRTIAVQSNHYRRLYPDLSSATPGSF